MNLLPFFEWLEGSPIGVFVKDKAATFATIEAVHLMALALLGAAVLSADLRLLNVVMRDVPSNAVTAQAHRWFKLALVFYPWTMPGNAIKDSRQSAVIDCRIEHSKQNEN